jgi:hypothetical protein
MLSISTSSRPLMLSPHNIFPPPTENASLGALCTTSKCGYLSLIHGSQTPQLCDAILYMRGHPERDFTSEVPVEADAIGFNWNFCRQAWLLVERSLSSTELRALGWVSLLPVLVQFRYKLTAFNSLIASSFPLKRLLVTDWPWSSPTCRPRSCKYLSR